MEAYNKGAFSRNDSKRQTHQLSVWRCGISKHIVPADELYLWEIYLFTYHCVKKVLLLQIMILFKGLICLSILVPYWITLYSPIASPDEFSGATVEFSPGEPVEIIYKTGPNKERVKILIFVPRPITSRHTVVTWAFWSRSETTSWHVIN